MNISYFTDSTNMVNVLTQNGTSLVDGMASYQLTKTPNPTTGMTDVGWQGPSGGTEDITSQITGRIPGCLADNPGHHDSRLFEQPQRTGPIDHAERKLLSRAGERDVNAGIPFFQSSTANCAQGISLASQIENGSGAVQTQNIMASSSTAEATDNDVALAIASLGNATLLGGSTITSMAASSDTIPWGSPAILP